MLRATAPRTLPVFSIEDRGEKRCRLSNASVRPDNCRRLRYALLEIHLGTCPLYHDLSVPQACLRQRTQKLMAALSWLRGYGPMVPPNTGVLAFRCDVSSCFAHCSKTCPLSFFVPLYRERCYRIVNGPRLLWILQELGEGWALPSLRDRSGQSLNIFPMSETTIVNLVHYIIIYNILYIVYTYIYIYNNICIIYIYIYT